MRRLFVLYDDRCGLCTWARRWLLRQPAFLELTFIPSRSPRVGLLFPGLELPGERDELVVISDEGGVYRSSSAWLMCLYALRDYRAWSLRLAQPMLYPLARQAFVVLSRRRKNVSRWLGLVSEAELAEALRGVGEVGCELDPPRPAEVPAGPPDLHPPAGCAVS
jgi:predicted DCC family thiol-disulfide oxidoreductase YuxK